MDTGKDYYAILGVLPEAEPEIIRAVYLALAKKYHPDSAGGTGNEERLKEINLAYEILKDPKKRKEYDNARAEMDDHTGDYDPKVDDEDLTADDLQSDWEFAVEYHPKLIDLLKEVSSISPTLSIVFQSTILSNKAFNDANKIKDRLILSFLSRYFGKSKPIQMFGKSLLLNKQMAAAAELNRAAKIFGKEIDYQVVIFKIKKQFSLLSENSDYWDAEHTPNAIFIAEYKQFGIFLRDDGKYIVFISPNVKAANSLSYSDVKTAEDFIDHYISNQYSMD